MEKSYLKLFKILHEHGSSTYKKRVKLIFHSFFIFYLEILSLGVEKFHQKKAIFIQLQRVSIDFVFVGCV